MDGSFLRARADGIRPYRGARGSTGSAMTGITQKDVHNVWLRIGPMIRPCFCLAFLIQSS